MSNKKFLHSPTRSILNQSFTNLQNEKEDFTPTNYLSTKNLLSKMKDESNYFDDPDKNDTYNFLKDKFSCRQAQRKPEARYWDDPANKDLMYVMDTLFCKNNPQLRPTFSAERIDDYVNQNYTNNLPEPPLKPVHKNPFFTGKDDLEQIALLNKDLIERSQREIKSVYENLKLKLTPTEDNLFKLTQIALNEASQKGIGENERIAWTHLANAFPIWLRRKHFSKNIDDNNEVLWVPWGWATATLQAKDGIINIINALLNDAAKKTLTKKLKDPNVVAELNNANGIYSYSKNSLFNTSIARFDFSQFNPVNWNRHSYQSRPVIYMDNYYQAQSKALGNYAIHALPKGTVTPLKGGGYEICISDVYLFVNDIFNFDGDALLGYWDFEGLKFRGMFPNEGSMVLGNCDFNNYRNRHKYGQDFRILSPLYHYPVDNLENSCWKVK